MERIINAKILEPGKVVQKEAEEILKYKDLTL
jgi:hypothetical protein